MDLRTILFIAFCAAALISFWFFWKKQDGKALIFLFLAAFGIRFFMIGLDPFLNEWDERFHALVAKNMMSNPFKPMLRTTPLFPYNLQLWCCNHIWLHKQPLFMWQMALSMKLFGVNEIAVRLPSALMGALLVWPVFRIGKLVFNRETGYFGALLFSFAYYQLELTSGAIGMDHNDVAFMFYVTCSIWAFFEYDHRLRHNQRSYKWLILVGVFAGFAVLCKWLTGLLVFGGWGLTILTETDRRKNLQAYLDAFLAFGISVLVFLPWQLYTAWRFPAESSYEREYNTRHVFEVLEGHVGSWWFYLEKLNFHYGYFYWPVLAIGLVAGFFLIKPGKKAAFYSYILIPYVFFSFIAQTKVVTYTYFVAPLMYLLIGSVLFMVTNYINKRKGKPLLLPTGILLLVFGVTTLRYPDIVKFHLKTGKTDFINLTYRSAKVNNAEVYKELNNMLWEGFTVFNCKVMEEIDAMFYSDFNVYNEVPTAEEYEAFKKQGLKMAFFKDHNSKLLPDYIKNDSSAVIIDWKLE